MLATCVIAPLAHPVVTLSGVSDELAANIKAHLKLDEEACEADVARIRYRFDSAEREIKAALRPFGYYEAEVRSELIEPEEDCWLAEFEIEPGEPVLVRAVETDVIGEGADLEAFQTVLAASEMRVGAQLRHDAYEKLKTQLVVISRELGFFEAVLVQNELLVDPDKREASVVLVLDTGARFHFGDLHINGEVLDESVIRRFVQFKSGAPFEQVYVRRLRTDLMQGGYFESVDVRTRQLEDRSVDVYLEVSEARRIRYGVGVGFGTDTGLIVRGDVENRRVNRRGHRLELDSEVSKVKQNVTFDYRIPGRRPRKRRHEDKAGLGARLRDHLPACGACTSPHLG